MSNTPMKMTRRLATPAHSASGRRHIIALLTTAALTTGPVNAVNFEWDGGAGDSLWNSVIFNPGLETNWAPENVPISTDNIILTAASLPGPITIDLNGDREVNTIHADGVTGDYTFINNGSGALELFGTSNALLNDSPGTTLSIDADVLLNAENATALFNITPTGGTIVINGGITSSAASGTTTLELSSRNLALEPSVLITGVISDGADAGLALSAGFAADAPNHRGVVKVTGLNTFTGATDVNGAILEFDSIANVGGSANALGQPMPADSTINVGHSTTSGALRYTGTGHASDRVINMQGTTGGALIDASGSAALVLSGGITAAVNGTKTLTLTGNNTDENTLTGIITDVGGGDVHINKSGPGTWVLSGANQASGNHNINEGELILRGVGARISALGAFANTLLRVNNDATFTLEGGTVTAREMDRGANATFNFKSGTVNLSAATSTFNAAGGPVTIGTDGAGTMNLNGTAAQFNDGVVVHGADDVLDLNSGSISTTSLDNANGGTFTFTGGTITITGGQITTGAGSFGGNISGTGGITKIGPGQLIMNAGTSNSHTGPTNINEGSLVIVGGGNQLQNTLVTIAAGASLDLTPSSGEGFSALAGEGDVLIGPGAGLGVGSSQSSEFSGTISGNGAFTKSDTSTLTLLGNNTYTGVTTISGGTLKLGPGDTLSDTTRVHITASGATLDLNNANEEIGGLAGVPGSSVNLGTATLTAGGNNETLNFDGTLTGTGGLTKTGLGTMRLRASNPFTGDVNVNQGTLEIGQANTLSDNAVIVAAGTTLRIAGDGESWGSLAGAGTLNILDTTFGANPGHNDTDTTFSGNATGPGALIKSGIGTMTMTGMSDYTGLTRLDNGLLEFDGASAGETGTSSISLNGGDLTVKNDASVSTTGTLDIRFTGGTVNHVQIESGGTVTTGVHFSIGEVAGSEGSATVTGVGSLLQSGPGDRVRPGNSGVGTLNVLDGGKVMTTILGIADSHAAAAGSAVVVDGFINNGTNGLFGDDDDVVSLIDAETAVFVGDVAQASLTIQNGGRVTSGTSGNNHLTNTSNIGAFATADGAIATITGNQSQWVHNGFLEIARFGGNATNPVELKVLDGGFAEFSHIFTTPNDGSRSKITVDGAGSLLYLRDARDDAGVTSPGFGDIRMVPSGSNGFSEIFVTDAGTINVDTRLAIGQGTADFGGQAHVTIDGADSTIDVGNELIVALAGTTASLTITDGGTANSGTDDTVVSPVRDSFISHTSGNGTATVGAPSGSDAGHAQAAWNIAANLYIAGNQGGNNTSSTGTLNINPTGRVSVAGNLRVWDRGTINLDGGILEVDSIDLTDSSGAIAESPTFNFNAGTLAFTTTPEKTLDVAELVKVLGPLKTLNTGQHLQVVNEAILTTELRINGGEFSAGMISPTSAAMLDHDAGTFNLTGEDLLISPAGQFGPFHYIEQQNIHKIKQNAIIDAGARLIIEGGFFANLLTNNGDLVVIDTTINAPIHSPVGSTITVIGTVNFEDAVTGAADFFGPGTAVFGAAHAPGDSPAAIHFEGSLAYGPAATLEIELGGLTPGTQHDQINVDGSAALDGTIDIQVIDGFDTDIVPFDTFTVMTWGDNPGASELDQVTYTAPVSIPGIGFDATYNLDDLVIEATGLGGDANLDGTVDLTDLTILAINFETPESDRRWRKADFNDDNKTDLTDLTILAINFGASISNGAVLPGPGADIATLAAAAGLNLSAVPEPGTVVLLAGPGAWMLMGRRKPRA